MNTKFVVYEEEQGVFLGTFLGLGFWSKLDAAGQDAAPAFDSIEQAKHFISQWPESEANKDYKFVAVEMNGPFFASIDECVKAGLPAWNASFEYMFED